MPVAELFVDGVVLLVLMSVRRVRMRVMRTRVEVPLVRLGAGMDDAGYAGCDAPLVQGGRCIVLDERQGRD